MTNDQDAPTPRRRTVLETTAAAGLFSLAGCSHLEDRLDDPGTDTRQSTEPPTSSPTDSGPPPESDGALSGIYGYRVASEFADEGEGTPQDPWVLSDDVLDDPGVVVLDAGSFTTDADGLITSSDVDYQRWSTWLRGAGVRTTSLHKRTESTRNLLSFTSDDDGNFGGVRDMGLYGSYPDGPDTTGHLLHSNGDIIDLLFENLIVRYGWKDGIRVDASASGTRIRNCWVENNGGWAITLGGGTRAKLSNTHIVTSERGGVDFGPSSSQVSNCSFYDCDPSLRVDGADTEVANCYFTLPSGGVAIEETDGCRSNNFVNISVYEAGYGVRTAARESSYANVSTRFTNGPAMEIAGDRVTVTGLSAVDVGSAGGGMPALDLRGDDVRVTGVSVAQESDPFEGIHQLARVTGDRVHLSDVNARGGPWEVVVDGATETVLDGVRGVTRGSLVDGGTRTLLNREGTNDGDPRSEGEWEDQGTYAHAMGATVWDASTDPWTPYRADGEGAWLEA